MTSAEALRDIRGYASAGRVRFSSHACQRMNQRGATARDVVNTCARASRAAEPGRWKATGPDFDGDELTVVVTIKDGLTVVTVF